MTSSIEFDKRGLIESGEDQGSYVLVQDDRNNTGGFRIIIAPDPDFGRDGGDYWVEDEASLQKFFDDSRWVIRWLD